MLFLDSWVLRDAVIRRIGCDGLHISAKFPINTFTDSTRSVLWFRDTCSTFNNIEIEFIVVNVSSSCKWCHNDYMKITIDIKTPLGQGQSTCRCLAISWSFLFGWIVPSHPCIWHIIQCSIQLQCTAGAHHDICETVHVRLLCLENRESIRSGATHIVKRAHNNTIRCPRFTQFHSFIHSFIHSSILVFHMNIW